MSPFFSLSPKAIFVQTELFLLLLREGWYNFLNFLGWQFDNYNGVQFIPNITNSALFCWRKNTNLYAVKKSPLNKGFLNYILDPLDSILENIWTLETLIFIFSWSTCQEKIKFCWSYPFKCCALVAILKELYICLFHPINNCIMESIW